MKRNILLTCFMLIFAYTHAQTNLSDFIKESALWVYYAHDGRVTKPYYYYYKLMGDTTINDIKYNELWYSDTSETEKIGALRCVDSKVYLYYSLGEIEILLYDFSLSKNDKNEKIIYDKSSLPSKVYNIGTILINNIDTILINNNIHKVYHLEFTNWIENIGCTYDLIDNIRFPQTDDNPPKTELVCFMVDNQTYYPNRECDCLKHITQIKESKPTTDFAITPNPADESFAIKLEDWENIQSVSLFDENGKLVERFAPASEIVVDCSQMVSGVYVCQIVDKKGNISSKKVIVK